MIEKPIPLLLPELPTATEIAPLLAIIDANKRYTNFGPLVDIFEEMLASILLPSSGKQHLVTMSNGTSAIEVCLHACDLPPGANVLIPSFTFVATARAVQNAGLNPVFADINSETLTLTPEIARKALNNYDLVAVLPVASFGKFINLRSWKAFTDDTGIPVIVDGAASFDNIPEPFACPVAISFHATKSLPVGEGGAIIYEDEAFIAKCRNISNFGLQNGLSTTKKGVNAKMSEYQAAMGIKSLEKWKTIRKTRTQLLTEYYKRLLKLPNVSLGIDKNTVASCLPIRVQADIADLANYFSLHGVETRRWYYPPLHLQPSFNNALCIDDLKNTLEASQTLLGLPFHTRLTTHQIDYICDIFWKYLETHEESHHLRSGTNS